MNLWRRLLVAAGAVALVVTVSGCQPPWDRWDPAVVAPGEVVRNLAVIGSLSSGDALIPFDRPYSEQVVIGTPVVMTFESVPGLTLTGRVKQLNPIPSSIAQKMIYHAVVGLPGNDPRLRDGQYVRAVVHLVLVPKALVIPNGAVHNENGQTFALDLDGNRQVFAAGMVGDDVTEVKSGLTQGQQVRLPR